MTTRCDHKQRAGVRTAPDPVSAARDHLLATLRETPYLCDTRDERAVPVYDQQELLGLKRRLTAPCIGLVYAGLTGTVDKTATGAHVTVNFDVYLIGGDRCHIAIDDTEADSTQLLGVLRAHLIDRLNDSPGGHRAYRLVSEAPVQFDDLLAYRQRWATQVVIKRR